MKNFLLLSLALLTGFSGYAQLHLDGVITTVNKLPVGGVLIQVQGSLNNTISAANGHFSLTNVKPGNVTISTTILGYETAIEQYRLTKDTSVVIQLIEQPFLANEVTVTATRADKNSGVAYTELSKNDIAALNLGQDVPYVLQLLPSVVTTSDAGAGVGYTGIRIRGSDASRTNVTINGIPLNDAESQQVYWVDLPDFASSAENIQVQRGVGTSTNGAGAFGGSVNILTSNISQTPYATTANSIGSFNTIKNNLAVGTGLLDNHFVFEGRLSRITSSGYIDRGSSDLKSYYAAGSYISKKTIVRINMFSGNEITYQCWNGVPESRIKGDQQGMIDYINRNYLDAADANNLLHSGRNYNMFTYDNQTDNYKQNHYQLLFSHQLTKKLLANIALHLTQGEGYFEEYQKDQLLADYGIEAPVFGNETVANSDLIRRKWLKNDFYGTTYSLEYNSHLLRLTFGGAWNKYDGGHFGEVIWSKVAGNSDIRHRYYDYDARKTDFNNYAKAEFDITKEITMVADMQIRLVGYHFDGPGQNGEIGSQSENLVFLNPKYGITWHIDSKNQFYGSFAVAHKEANSDDYLQSTPSSRPKPEELFDYELSYKRNDVKFQFGVTSYLMTYNNQLVLTGQINDVGNYTHTNVKQSYRQGIELEGAVTLTPHIRFLMNFTYSKNWIHNFTEYADNYDNGSQDSIEYHDKSIAFSPDIIGMAGLNFSVFKNFDIQLSGKYIGKQFLDNTGRDDRKIDPYAVCDARLSYVIYTKIAKEIRFNVLFNNLLNETYCSNGYTYGYISNQSRVQENFYYPQAGFNTLAQVTLKF
jgi:iron complex outermembrane receptor protein